jgi:hypothetical protein
MWLRVSRGKGLTGVVGGWLQRGLVAEGFWKQTWSRNLAYRGFGGRVMAYSSAASSTRGW